MYTQDRYAIAASTLKSLEMSVFAEQVFNSIVSELQVFSQVPEFDGWKDLQAADEEASYHRNAAVGHLRRILWGNSTSTSLDNLLVLTAHCCVLTRDAEKKAGALLTELADKAPTQDEGVKMAWKWHNRRRRQLKHAALGLKATMPKELWQKGVQLAKQG